jgi:hypothetical protein
MRLSSSLVLLCTVLAVLGQTPNKELDCEVKQFALEYAAALFAGSDFHKGRNATALISKALKLSECGKAFPKAAKTPAAFADTTVRPATSAAGGTFYVSPTGSDTAAGTKEAPFGSLGHAQQAARAASGGGSVTVYLLAGRYELTEPFILTPADSGTTYTAFDKGEVVLSGGRRLKADWTVHDATSGIWKTKVPAGTAAFRTMFVEDVLQIPARWPNGRHDSIFPEGYAHSEDDQGGCQSWAEDVEWKTEGKKTQVGEGHTSSFFQGYVWQEGGSSELFERPLWARESSLKSFQFDDYMNDYSHTQHSGVWSCGHPNVGKWKTNVDGIVVHAMQGNFW